MNEMGKSGYESRGLNFAKLSQQVSELLQQVKGKIIYSFYLPQDASVMISI